MGGYGSGRPSYKNKAEDCHSLDLYKMKRLNCLQPNKQGNWIWSRDGEETARIGYHCNGDTLALSYRVRQYGGDWETISQTARLTYSDCNYGGQRVYVICPGTINGRRCGRRVGKLFLGNKYFLCRHCNSLGYASQSEPQCDRMLRRANKLRMELGGEPGTASWIALRPKGMWQRTYDRKVTEIESCENQANIMFLKILGLSESRRTGDVFRQLNSREF